MKKLVMLCIVSLLLASCGQASPGVQATPNAQATPIVGNHEANPDHLAKLMEGVDAWNAWRLQNPKVRPDLRKVKLARTNLKNYDLRSAVLNNADLVNANLVSANLINADLKGTDLSNANLRGANLSKADLTNAILTGAKYNSKTKWPDGFDPVAAGATLVAQ